MKSMKERAAALVGFACLVCLSAFSAAASAATDRFQIGDPAMLEKMGFPPDSANVYQAVPKGNPGAETNSDYGTPIRYTTIAPKAFVGRQNSAASPWEFSGGAVGCCANLSRTGSEPFADAQINLPDGVVVSGLRFWANDTNSVSDILFFVFEACYPAFGPGSTSYTVLSTGAATTSNTGDQSAFASFSATINNQSCVYTARLNFEATTGLTFQKLRFQWQRVITPGPVTPTFTDVPTSYPFYNAIEALAAAGITSGCTVTQYCPEAAITRGQMAVFLSRALGL